MSDFAAIRNRQPFELRAHLRLKALRDVSLIIPVGILAGQDKPLSELVMLNDDETEIGVMEAPNDPGQPVAFVVFLKNGQEIELGRSTEVMVDGLVDGEAPFKLSDNQHAVN